MRKRKRTNIHDSVFLFHLGGGGKEEKRRETQRHTHTEREREGERERERVQAWTFLPARNLFFSTLGPHTVWMLSIGLVLSYTTVLYTTVLSPECFSPSSVAYTSPSYDTPKEPVSSSSSWAARMHRFRLPPPSRQVTRER